MIIARSPLRITLGGGGTDLPSYYEKHTGFLISAAIDKHVYVQLSPTLSKGLLLRYSKTERVQSLQEIEHPIIREALKWASIPDLNLEICSIADIPAGTGLGSSGSFTTALLKALHTFRGNPIPASKLAEEACHIEMNLLQEPVGKQDPYVAAHGGVNGYEFLKDGTVQVFPLRLSRETTELLEENLLLFFTGYSRKASTVLQEQNQKSMRDDQEMVNNLHFIKEMGFESKKAIESGNLTEFARLMNRHWEYKKKRSTLMSNPLIDDWYKHALEHGALGGKLIGAGGGGFLMFYAEEPKRLREAMILKGLKEVPFRFDKEGTRTLQT